MTGGDALEAAGVRETTAEKTAGRQRKGHVFMEGKRGAAGGFTLSCQKLDVGATLVSRNRTKNHAGCQEAHAYYSVMKPFLLFALVLGAGVTAGWFGHAQWKPQVADTPDKPAAPPDPSPSARARRAAR